MKLRDKKTGEVIILIDHTFDNYNSLAEVMRDWEDYKPKEPLIKDPKIRKAVRVWADKSNIKIVRVDLSGSCLVNYPAVIQFFGTPFSELKNIEYTIAELCREEEE